ncbi:hybrid sensor histidine kinase/response regulator [Sphingomonas koreensis]|nr:hybrid sensor histidine kinase/response regulator [Sphingomonas koreensis]
MASLMRAKNWSETALGPVEGWPEPLKIAVRILLTSKFDMWLGWGEDVTFLYNDAYRPTLGNKHPHSLAAPTRVLWAEIWPDIGPLIQQVYEQGEATWSEALFLLLERNGYSEETYHTFSYSPVFDGANRVGGVLCTVVEETERVITSRRLEGLRILATELTAAESPRDVLAAAQAVLAANSKDVPFSLIYLFDGDTAHLVGSTGFELGHSAALESVPLSGDSLWPVTRPHAFVDVSGLGDLPSGEWRRPPHQALIVPLGGQGEDPARGAIVVGLNPHLTPDAEYIGYLDLFTGQVASGLASAEAHDAARRRAADLADAARLREEAAEALSTANAILANEVETRTAERDRLRTLFQRAPGFMCSLAGPDHVFEFMNTSYLQLVGHRDLIGMPVGEALPEIAGQGFFELLDEVFATGEPFVGQAMPVDLQRAPNSPLEKRYLDLVYQPIVEIDGTVSGIFAQGHDVTDKVRSEQALRDLNADLERQVVERTQARGMTWQLSPDLLGALNSKGYFETSNPAWRTVLGWTEAEVASMSIFELLHPDDVEATRKGFALTNQGKPAIRFPNRYRCKDGSYRWISWIGIPEEGLVYCSGRDITEEKAAAAELASAQAALRQSQKMEAVGQLTGGIAHDFNNLLAGVSGNLELLGLRMEQGQMTGLERYVVNAQEAARRAASLTQRLLAFSRRQTLDPKPTDTNRLIGGMEDLVRRTVGPAIELKVVGSAGLGPVCVDQSQLENALLNLTINARDAMPGGGRITIETANRWLDDHAARERDLTPGQYVSICVTDTGTGMPPAVIAQAFDPFFTTKPLGQGTGLGLSMIHGFVRQSGGQVGIDSELGIGTTMCLYLPRFTGALEPQERGVEAPAVDVGHGETVLVIDDEEAVRALVVEVLAEAGYNVLEAEDGPSGLKLLQRDIRVDLLITDVGLPGGLNGRQVADAARQDRPDLKVLFITGYAENAAVGNGQLAPGMQVITKPFGVAALGNKVREILDR